MVNVRKERMPPEHLRRTIKLSKSLNYSNIGALKFFPYAIHNFLSSIPMPWEPIKYVEVIYHINGIVTFVTSKDKISVTEYRNKWSSLMVKYNQELNRTGFIKQLRYPIFDDDEQLDYSKILNVGVPKGIEINDEISIFKEYQEEYLFNWKTFNVENKISKDVIFFDQQPEVLKLAYPYLFNSNLPKLKLEKFPLPNNGNLEEKIKRKKNPFDISLLKFYYLKRSFNTTKKHKILLKNYTKNMKKIKKRKSSTKILKKLKNTRFFQRTEIDWLEAGIQLINQGHRMLNEILKRKKITYLILDYNFNLKPLRVLTTKERKKSRVGTSFHLIREILKFLKNIVDVHFFYRQGNINSWELMNNLNYIFTNVGVISGIYRYKYKLMSQIKQCKSLDQIGKDIGLNPWAEKWRVWVFMMRGHIPLLKKYTTGLTDRLLYGREERPKPVSKQRIESNFDIELKRKISEEASDILPPRQIKLLLKHFSEAWRCWKSDTPYSIVYEQKKDEPDAKKYLLNESNTENSDDKEDLVTLNTLQAIINKYIKVKSDWYIQSAIQETEMNKKLIKKRLGKISRLYMKEEIARQRDYLLNPQLNPSEAVAVFTLAAEYFKNKNIKKISFPDKNEEIFLSISIDRLKITATDEEKEFYSNAMINSADTIYKIKKAILSQRTFKEVEVCLKNKSGKGCLYYKVFYWEKLVDAFLNAYILYEVDKLSIFPKFIKPDDELEIKSVKSFCEEVSEYRNNDSVHYFVYEGEFNRLMENIDVNLLLKLLKLIMDAPLADYIISRNNCTVNYKDMKFTNSIGYLKGFQLSPFIFKFYSFIIDLCFLGTDFFFNQSSSIKLYRRHGNKFYVLFEIKRDKIKNVEHSNYFETDEENEFKTFSKYIKEDNKIILDKLKHMLHLEMATRIPPAFGNVKMVNVSSEMKFSICGFDVLINEKRINEHGFWRLPNNIYANISVSQSSIEDFKIRIDQILLTSLSATFPKIVNRWNNAILSFCAYFREAVKDTDGLFEILLNSEKLIKNLIKKGINSKMPIRFPNVMFYTPVDLGGLGMLSIGNDLKNQTELFQSEIRIPCVLDYLKRWDVEFEESDKVWLNYSKTGKIEKGRGVPRMETLLQKNKYTFYERGFRLINKFKVYTTIKNDPFHFTDTKHDGKLWCLEDYSKDVLKALGGKDSILEHTLFKATNFAKFDRLFWENPMINKYKNLTAAQKTGVSQVPNRRFILWWSPTINRANVYVGYQVQLEPTGIFMHGKLPTLKISYLQIFKNKLWSKIHQSVVDDLFDGFKKYCDAKKLYTSSKRPYSIVNAADILITGNFYVAEEFLENTVNVKHIWISLELRWGDYDKKDSFKYSKVRFYEISTDPLFKLPESKNDKNLQRQGIVIVVDLCYNTYSAYGYLSKELKELINLMLEKIVKNNLMINIFRERLRKNLQLYTSDIEKIKNSSELYGMDFIIDAHLLSTKTTILFIFNPLNGNLYFKKYDSGKKRQIKTDAAEDIFTLAKELNKKNIAATEEIIDYLENQIIDYPNVKLKLLENNILISNILKLRGIEKKLEEASSMHYINLYEQWDATNSFTNFCRFLLIIQSLGIDDNQVITMGIEEIWPKFDDNTWIDKEIMLKNIIVDEYCLINNLNPLNLSSNEIRSIVFGFKDFLEIEEEKEIKVIKQIPPVLSAQNFNESSTWRELYLLYEKKIESEENFLINDSIINNQNSENKSEIEIPKNIINQFYLIKDDQTLFFSLIIDNTSYAIPPQFSTKSEIHSSHYTPEGFEFKGIIINTSDINIIETICKRYNIYDPIAIVFEDTLYTIKRSKKTWEKCKSTLTDNLGVFYLPEIWNYNFMKPFFSDDLKYSLKLGTPKGFYDGNTRITHFTNFWSENVEQDSEDY